MFYIIIVDDLWESFLICDDCMIMYLYLLKFVTSMLMIQIPIQGFIWIPGTPNPTRSSYETGFPRSNRRESTIAILGPGNQQQAVSGTLGPVPLGRGC